MTKCRDRTDAERQLDELSCERPESELVQAGVDIAQVLTGSRIAYLHFLNEDQDTIELGAWSSDTASYCTAVHDRHYPISMAGIWADTARRRQACIHNDYASTAGRRGLPDGHSPLVRHLGVPLVDEDRVRLLLGVGNRPADYGPDDVATLERVARRVWSEVRQRRLVERLLDVERRFTHLQDLARVAAWEYDAGIDRVRFDHQARALLGLPAGAEPPATLGALLEHVAPAHRDRVRAAFAPADDTRRHLRLDLLRADGSSFAVALMIERRPRGIGRGWIVYGILQDLSRQQEADDLRRLADTDALTGLPNRRRLEAMFAELPTGGRRAADRLAFHFVDLDDFKPVNDRFGHAMGDAVLRALAGRLEGLLRRDDLVARVGGDEFVVVQRLVDDIDRAAALADKIVATLGAPVSALGHTVAVGASVGIAVGAVADGLAALSRRADRALYRAKAGGGRGWRFDDGA